MSDMDDDVKRVVQLSIELAKRLTPELNSFISAHKDMPAHEVLTAVAGGLAILSTGTALAQPCDNVKAVELALLMQVHMNGTIQDMLQDPAKFVPTMN
ncbi:MAG TPA: hypothetical protein VH621_03345 [Nitrososphaera sp.]|jgi:hypothetical protein